MKQLPDHIENSLRTYLSEEDQVLNKDQACLDFAAIVEAAKTWERHLLSKRHQQPQPIRILALLFAEMYYEHTGHIIHRGRKGGPYARMLLILANAAGLVDLRTGLPYSEKQAQEAIKSTRDDINARAGVKSVEGAWLQDDARAKVLKTHIVGYENAAGDAVEGPFDINTPVSTNASDDDGLEQGSTSFPIFGGYEPGRVRRLASETFKEALAGLLKESS